MADSPSEIIDFARSLITDCGQCLRQKCQNSVPAISEKDGHNDIVTDHDVWAERYLSDRILARYPDHGMLSEEGLQKSAASPWTWIVDPIDGTVNYVATGKDYAISIGIYYRNAPFYGLVLDVSENRLFESPYVRPEAREHDEETPGASIVFASHRTMVFLKEEGLDPFAFFGRYQGVRYLGCASLELCRLPMSRNGIYISSQLKAWDFAAAQCVLSGQGVNFFARPMRNRCHFAIACRSISLLEDCLSYMPLSVRNLYSDLGGKIHA